MTDHPMRRPVLIILVFLCSHGFNGLANAQMLSDTVDERSSTTHPFFRPDSLYSPSFTQNGTWLGFDHVLSIYEWKGKVLYLSHENSSSDDRSSELNDRNDTVWTHGDSRFLQDNAVTTTSLDGYISAEQPTGTAVR